jgi:RNA 2',3'-cyclic 3'-phosphodiesterase
MLPYERPGPRLQGAFMRCFVAIELAEDVRRPLIEFLGRLPRASGVRWVTPDQLHITLKFLGEVPEQRLGTVQGVVTDAAAEIAPFTIQLAGLGAFPTPRSPRVLWCGVQDEQQACGRWVAAADPRFAALGYEPEERAFTPHLTLGRSKDPSGAAAMRDVLARLKGPPMPRMEVTEVVLFESRLRPTGAVYVPVLRAPLRG